MKLSTLAAALSLAATCACAQSTLKVKQLMLDSDLNATYATLTETQVNNLGIIASGSVILDDGSLSAPSLRFTSDTNTGIRRSASDTLQFVAGGSSIGTWSGSSLAVVGGISATTGINSTTIGASTPATGAFTTLTTTSTIAATGNVTGANLAGTNTGDVTLTSGAGDILGLSGQTLDFDSQAANLFLASPNGSSGVPTFRAIAEGDLYGAGVGLLAEEQAWSGLNSFLGGLESKVTTLAPALVIESQGLTSATIETVETLTVRTATAPANGRGHSFRVAVNDSSASFAHVWPDASGTFVNTAASPLSINATTGEVSLTSTTGSGAVVQATSPTLVTPALGTPTTLVLTNATGLPLTSGVTGTLPIANGGTNSTATPTANYVMVGNGSAIVPVRATAVPGSVVTIKTLPGSDTDGDEFSLSSANGWRLTANGDAVEYDLLFFNDTASAAFRTRFAGNIETIDMGGFPSGSYVTMKFRIVRESNTVIRWTTRTLAESSLTPTMKLTSGEITGLDLAATDYTVGLLVVGGSGADTVRDFRATFHRAP